MAHAQSASARAAPALGASGAGKVYVSDILHRIELHSPEQGHSVLTHSMWPWAKAQLQQGRELVLEARLLDDAITEAQRGYLHGVVLTEIALYGRANAGAAFPMKVWKEYFRQRLLPDRRMTSVNPITGKKTRRRIRVSTEELGVRRLAKYIDEVIAIAADELGVVVSTPLPLELRGGRQKKGEVIDAETGEILEVACA
jgi:hypothetical protein